MRELKLPSNNLNRNNYIENLPVNNYGYVVPWAVKVNEYDDVFINKKFTYSQQPGGTVKLKIKRTNQGIIIFLDNNYKFDDIGELDSIQNYEPVIGFDENENETLENQLEKAIEDEDYELANKIKIKMKQQIDEIKRMKQNINEIKRMQVLAGIKLNENTSSENGSFEHDDIIYDFLCNMNQEQLASELLNAAENDKNLTLFNYLKQYDYTEDEDEELNENESEISNNVTLKWINPDDSNNGNEIEVIYNGVSLESEEYEYDNYSVDLWTNPNSNEDILGINIYSSEPSFGGGYDSEDEVDRSYETYENQIKKLNILFKDLNKSNDDEYVSISKNDISNWNDFINQIN